MILVQKEKVPSFEGEILGRMVYFQRLHRPLRITAFTREGQLLGEFLSYEISPQGIFVEGEVQELINLLRLSSSLLCILNIQEERKRPIRATVRLDLAASPRQRIRTKVFFRFVRMVSENQRRYSILLYGKF